MRNTTNTLIAAVAAVLIGLPLTASSADAIVVPASQVLVSAESIQDTNQAQSPHYRLVGSFDTAAPARKARTVRVCHKGFIIRAPNGRRFFSKKKFAYPFHTIRRIRACKKRTVNSAFRR